MNRPRVRNVKVREDDLAAAIGTMREWYESLADAAGGDGYGTPDPDTMRAVKRGLARADRLARAHRESFPRKPSPPAEPARMVTLRELREGRA
jgi:hypothetical protein